MTPATRPLRILYVATMHHGWYGIYRMQSLERLGHTLIPLEIERFQQEGNFLTRRVHFRLQRGGPVDRMNATVLAMAQEHRVDVVWFDKPLWIRIATLRRLRQMGIVTVDYMIDNPFGPRKDPGFGLYLRAIPEYDLHVQQRDISIEDYLAHGARRMVKVQTAFEPTVHFPPPVGWSDKDRTRQVSFIGTPYDQRANFLTSLWKNYGLPITVSGPAVWRRKLSRETCAAIYPQDGELYDADYRRGIWESRINLSFLTHGNQDEYAHKSFEIAACGGFLLAERSAGHSARFVEDEEAVFFSNEEECAAKIQKYLNDEPARTRIAAAGQRRAASSGYDNDAQMRKIFVAVEEILPVVQRQPDSNVRSSSRIFDLAETPAIPAFDADVCIVGAGAAGITLAAELIRQGKRVMLLESGGRELEEAVQQLNRCERTGQAQRAPHLGRFRAFGGTTTRWGGQIAELRPEDFTQRPWMEGSGWPIPKEVLQPYYKRALTAEGLSRVIVRDGAVWEQLGTAAADLGGEIVPYLTRWCPEPNFARLYRELVRSTQICIVLHATATELILDEVPGNATQRKVCGVRCRSLSGNEQIFQASSYVLCMGMMETTSFLLQPSKDGQRKDGQRLPWQRNGWLGCHVQSHIDYNAAKLVAIDRKRLDAAFANVYLSGRKYHPKLFLGAKAQERLGVLGIAGSITCISNVEGDIRQIKTVARTLVSGNWSKLNLADIKTLMSRLPILIGLAYGYQVRHRAYWPADSTLWLRVHGEQEPLSASRMTLSSERDAMGLFRAHLDWRVSPLEWKTIRHFTGIMQQALESAGLAKLEVQPEVTRDDGYRGLAFDDSYHWMGGTRMSSEAADGIVDINLKLHDVSNAYVCSLSVFPTSGFANPVHTLLALALRLADHLAGN